ncbi:MAG: lipid A biosynthesis acyltransferase [Pseudomonadota bacterium]
MKTIRYAIEAFALMLAFGLFKILPVSTASYLGGTLMCNLGPLLAASRKARRHIQFAFPNANEHEIERILFLMWDNIGRTFAEYPHLKKLASEDYTQIIGTEHIPEDGNAIIFGAHYGNWEVAGPAYKKQYGTAIHPVFREPNNPMAAWLLDRCRKISDDITTIPKSRSGTRRLMESLKSGKTVGILIDQKYNEGIAMPFFGRDAKTSPAFVQLAQKLDIPLIPVRIDRLDGPKFRVTLSQPLNVKDREVVDVIQEAHTILENNIREQPGHWLWLHRRWVKDKK